MRHSITFALRNNELVDITMVESGLGCNCYCLECGARLIAKKGDRQAHHFAHAKDADCRHGWETALHKSIKQLIARKKSINVPPVYLHRQRKAYFRAARFTYDGAETEPTLNDIRPDLLLTAGPKKLLIEIRVQHEVPKSKVFKLRRLGLPVLEIDALQLYEDHLAQKGTPDIAAFHDAVLRGLDCKQWLFNPQQQRAEYRLRKLAAERKVKPGRYKGYHQYIVEGCPARRRVWRSGFREGEAYANVIQDCMHCPFCIELEFEKTYAGFREVPLLPKKVHCWGHLEEAPCAKPWQSSV